MMKIRLPVAFEDGYQLYNAVLRLINHTNPSFATLIHDTPQYNPFSVQLPDVVCVLDPTLEMIAAQWKETQTINSLGLEEIMSMDHGGVFLRLHFEDTFFKRGHVSVPLPDPWNIVSSWKKRWNSVSRQKIGLEIPHDGEKHRNEIEVQHVRIKSRMVRQGDFNPYYAFSGFVKLKWLGDEEGLVDLWRLARFAEYAGTGAKTTMGCGVTRIEEPERVETVGGRNRH